MGKNESGQEINFNFFHFYRKRRETGTFALQYSYTTEPSLAEQIKEWI